MPCGCPYSPCCKTSCTVYVHNVLQHICIVLKPHTVCLVLYAHTVCVLQGYTYCMCTTGLYILYVYYRAIHSVCVLQGCTCM